MNDVKKVYNAIVNVASAMAKLGISKDKKIQGKVICFAALMMCTMRSLLF